MKARMRSIVRTEHDPPDFQRAHEVPLAFTAAWTTLVGAMPRAAA